MRNTFIKTLTKLAEKDKNVYFLTGDLGFSVFENFAEKFPKRFINCGVAEQNMIGVAAGLALSGKKVYIYSIIPFVTMRCFEQIRNDICYQNLDVKIIGMGGGFSYGELGATHYALEDVAILRSLPNMTIICPADSTETELLVLKSYQDKKPTYIRLTKAAEKKIYETMPRIEIGEPSVLRQGKDGIIIASGPQVGFSLEALKELKDSGYNLKLLSLHTLKPIDEELLLKEIEDIKNVFTVEEHNIIGGLGSAIAEILAESNWQGNFKRLAVLDKYPSKIGSVEYLREKYYLDSKGIAKFILKNLKKYEI